MSFLKRFHASFDLDLTTWVVLYASIALIATGLLLGCSPKPKAVTPAPAEEVFQYRGMHRVGECLSYIAHNSATNGNTGRVMSFPTCKVTDLTLRIDKVDSIGYTATYIRGGTPYTDFFSFSHVDDNYESVNCDGKYP
jgi:hypothetical protein